MKRVETFVEEVLFASRWLLVPFYLGLAACIALLLVKFGKEFLHFVEIVFTGTSNDVVIGLLTLIDVVLLANLLIIIIFAGYENFVSKIDTGGHEDRPDWMGHVSFADLKMKLMLVPLDRLVPLEKSVLLTKVALISVPLLVTLLKLQTAMLLAVVLT